MAVRSNKELKKMILYTLCLISGFSNRRVHYYVGFAVVVNSYVRHFQEGVIHIHECILAISLMLINYEAKLI